MRDVAQGPTPQRHWPEAGLTFRSQQRETKWGFYGILAAPPSIDNRKMQNSEPLLLIRPGGFEASGGTKLRQVRRGNVRDVAQGPTPQRH